MEHVPDEVRGLFTAEVLTRLRAVPRPPSPVSDSAAEPIRQRHLILSGDDLPTNFLRLRRPAWWAYLTHAASTGLVDQDMRQRITAIDDDLFRGALAECLVSWFFFSKLGLTLRRHDAATGVRRADFESDGNLRVEVKSPYVPLLGNHWAGDDTDVLRKCVSEAGSQFKPGYVNLVALVPLLRNPLSYERNQLLKATIGSWALSVPISLNPAIPAPKPTNFFRQTGKLAKLFPKPDGTARPDLTRVSAVVAIEEESVWTDSGPRLMYVVHVVHNPFANDAYRADKEMFSAYPQLLVTKVEGDESEWEMAWSDGKPAFP